MKDHEIAQLVNAVTKKIKVICPNAPQSLREAVSKTIKTELDVQEAIKKQ